MLYNTFNTARATTTYTVPDTKTIELSFFHSLAYISRSRREMLIYDLLPICRGWDWRHGSKRHGRFDELQTAREIITCTHVYMIYCYSLCACVCI